MDFSSPESALRSLQRRPSVPQEFKDVTAACEGPFLRDAKPASLGGAEQEELLLRLLRSDIWECVAVGFMLSKHVVTTVPTSAVFQDAVLVLAELHLEHAEPRVRGLVAQTLGAIAKAEVLPPEGGSDDGAGAARGLGVYHRFQERLTESIQTNFERTCGTITDRVSGPGKEVAVDDTTGWKALETSLLALKEFVDAIGRPFLAHGGLTPGLLKYIVAGATEHVNRHVREASFKIITSVLQAAGSLGPNEPPPEARLLADAFATAIGIGLQDNWSQVRFAASVACRALLTALRDDTEWRESYYPLLLPRMCLNRYYMAEGVKLYSQETWRIFMADKGRLQVAVHAASVADYYAWASDADNHVVREAACHSIAEAAVKVDHAAMAPHVGRLLSALLVCFHDESWPVRDAACVATGRFAGAFPEECRPSLDNLWERWLHHLSDPIWSVRENSAVALAEVCRAYGDNAVAHVCAWVAEALPKATIQPAQTNDEWRRTHNDAAAHTDKQRYSCGSLAPKLKKGSRKAGCSDCEVSRATQPWEYTDGAVYMIRELCGIVPAKAVAFFPAMAEAARLTHFVQADFLRETVFKQLPAMAHALGKKEFKRHLDLFLEPIFATLQRPSAHQLALHSAGACARELSVFVGPGIFRGRLTPEQLEIFDTSPYCPDRSAIDIMAARAGPPSAGRSLGSPGSESGSFSSSPHGVGGVPTTSWVAGGGNRPEGAELHEVPGLGVHHADTVAPWLQHTTTDV